MRRETIGNFEAQKSRFERMMNNTKQEYKDINERIQMAQTFKYKNYYLTFGMTEFAYNHFKEERQISPDGQLINIKTHTCMDAQEDLEEDEEEEHNHHSQVTASDRLASKLTWEQCLDSLVISPNNRLYQFEQVCISICAFVSGYIYAYFAYFGPGNWSYEVFEGIFLFDMLLSCFVEFTEHEVTVREISQITSHYFKTNFFLDFIPLLPIERIQIGNGHEKIFFVIKTIRLGKGYQFFSIEAIINEVKKFYKEKSNKLVASGSEKAYDTTMDHNKVNQIIFIQHCLKTVKLIVLILNFSYFFSIGWIIVCALNDEIYSHTFFEAGSEGLESDEDHHAVDFMQNEL